MEPTSHKMDSSTVSRLMLSIANFVVTVMAVFTGFGFARTLLYIVSIFLMMFCGSFQICPHF